MGTHTSKGVSSWQKFRVFDASMKGLETRKSQAKGWKSAQAKIQSHERGGFVDVAGRNQAFALCDGGRGRV